MRKFLLTAALLISSVFAFAQKPNVTISDTLFMPDGTTPFTGALTIQWPSFDLNGFHENNGQQIVQVVQGALNLALWPSDNAQVKSVDSGQPLTGFAYTVLATTNQGPILLHWVISSSAVNKTVSLSDVSPPVTAADTTDTTGQPAVQASCATGSALCAVPNSTVQDPRLQTTQWSLPAGVTGAAYNGVQAPPFLGLDGKLTFLFISEDGLHLELGHCDTLDKCLNPTFTDLNQMPGDTIVSATMVQNPVTKFAEVAYIDSTSELVFYLNLGNDSGTIKTAVNSAALASAMTVALTTDVNGHPTLGLDLGTGNGAAVITSVDVNFSDIAAPLYGAHIGSGSDTLLISGLAYDPDSGGVGLLVWDTTANTELEVSFTDTTLASQTTYTLDATGAGFGTIKYDNVFDGSINAMWNNSATGYVAFAYCDGFDCSAPLAFFPQAMWAGAPSMGIYSKVTSTSNTNGLPVILAAGTNDGTNLRLGFIGVGSLLTPYILNRIAGWEELGIAAPDIGSLPNPTYAFSISEGQGYYYAPSTPANQLLAIGGIAVLPDVTDIQQALVSTNIFSPASEFTLTYQQLPSSSLFSSLPPALWWIGQTISVDNSADGLCNGGGSLPGHCFSDGLTWISYGGGGGAGTVTSVSVTAANGVSGTVATPTTAPAISLVLGAITPTSIAVGPSPPALTPGTGSAIAWLEGTAPSICATSGVDCMYADSTLHAILFNFNGGTYGSLAPLASPTFTGVPAAPTASAATNSTQLATTAYVTTGIANAIGAVNPAIAVQAATVGSSDTSGLTYANGASGVGATFTGTANTAITIDGYTFTAVGQRLLVKNDTQNPSGAFNGMYSLAVLQTSGVAPVFVRALDYDQPSDMNNTGAIPVVNGTVNAATSWLLTSAVATVGTSPLTYIQFSINPANQVLAVAPGAGIAHFAGSTQMATSSAVALNSADTSGVLPVSKGGTQAQGSNVCGTSDLCATGTIAQAAITNLSATTSTFISLIAAPASGSMIAVDSAVFELVLGGATTYGSGAATSLYYGQSAALISSTTCNINFLANTTSRICFFGLGGNTQNTTGIAATGIYLGMASGSSYTCASTCGSVYYVIKYHIVTGL